MIEMQIYFHVSYKKQTGIKGDGKFEWKFREVP